MRIKGHVIALGALMLTLAAVFLTTEPVTPPAPAQLTAPGAVSVHTLEIVDAPAG